jgi:rhodanese-related sulfurtransferase
MSDMSLLAADRPRPYSGLKAAGVMLLIAVACGLAFNLAMPQGIPWQPTEVAHPDWQAATGVQALELQRQGALVLDARDAGSYAQGRVRGALKLPADELTQLWPLLRGTVMAAPAVVVYGASFSSFPAAAVGQFLRGQGLKRVYVVRGCLDTMREAGFPIQEPRRKPAP